MFEWILINCFRFGRYYKLLVPRNALNMSSLILFVKANIVNVFAFVPIILFYNITTFTSVSCTINIPCRVHIQSDHFESAPLDEPMTNACVHAATKYLVFGIYCIEFIQVYERDVEKVWSGLLRA